MGVVIIIIYSHDTPKRELLGDHLLLLAIDNILEQAIHRTRITPNKILEFLLGQRPRLVPRLGALDLDERPIVLDLQLTDTLKRRATQNIAHLRLHKLLVLTELAYATVDGLQLVVQRPKLTHTLHEVTLIKSCHSGIVVWSPFST